MEYDKGVHDAIMDAFSGLGKTGCYTAEALFEFIEKNHKQRIKKEKIEQALAEDKEKYIELAKKKYKLAKLPALLLVGNSPNLVERYNAKVRWDRLLKDMEMCYQEYLKNTNKLRSFPQRMQAICNLYYLLTELPDDGTNNRLFIEEKMTDWFKYLKNLKPTFVLKKLAKLDFDYYLTTNYDLALERALNAKKKSAAKCDSSHFLNYRTKKKIGKSSFSPNIMLAQDKEKVTHIHGAVTDLNNIVMTPLSYVEATHELVVLEKNTNSPEYKSSWLKAFCESEVHICGLELSSEESLVWYAIEAKTRYLQKVGKLDTSYPRTFVYLFYRYDKNNTSDYDEKVALQDLLRTYSVNTILIPVCDNDYISAWILLMGKMDMCRGGFKLEYSSIEEETDVLFEEALAKVKAGSGSSCVRNSNLSTASVPHYIYPYHCLLTVSSAKKNIIRQKGRWLVHCKIGEQRYMYTYSDKACVKKIGTGEDRSNFLVDYRTGKLYRIEDQNIVYVGQGAKANNLPGFVKLIKN